ncbi:murein DD-endopeptidase MepM/ murein hydrolase activator NlpD [Salirhabdus euzebyi]|uniref:Murein DD-endopeptidase MepM/ murein hydrolase activator NlpD n=1 Tax=Salirhabdus euzebyi TaxID=394506 RepID=A0A841Q8I9_9BACI|nr:M23 family metallopeptidase [Salirhabdus euzebyi]MBB6454781.1 murein DD-endopeptidase MepM/ murein hydrolase activator NlpD [Salirhabdus euzebyi]
MREYKKIDLPKQKGHKALLPKVVMTTVLGLGITIGSVYADSFQNNLPKVYHVYVNGEHLGTVGSKDVIESFIEEKVSSEEKKFEDLHLAVSEEITYIPEVAFQPVFNNERVIENLEDKITYSVQAVKLVVDGELVGYFNDKETAQQVLNKFIAKYVPEEIASQYSMKAIEQTTEGDTESTEEVATLSSSEVEETETTPVLSAGQSTILDVDFSKKVSIEEEKINPSELLTEEQAMKLLERGTIADQIHKIQSGEVLGSIAEKYNLSVTELISLNPNMNENSVLSIGQEVNVTGYKPFIDVIVTEDKMVEESIDYQVKYESSDELFKGQSKVKQEGQEGKKHVHYRITKENGNVVNREVINSEVVKEPVNKVIIQGTKVIPSRGTGSFRWPTAGGFITSGLGYRWGSYHKGIDIAGVSNRSIYAADNGIVKSAGWNGGYGYQVVIDHQNGFRTSYSHLSSIHVSPGQTVQRGQTIGIMGSTGNSTGVHLHFELYKNGALQNPSSYF